MMNRLKTQMAANVNNMQQATNQMAQKMHIPTSATTAAKQQQ